MAEKKIILSVVCVLGLLAILTLIGLLDSNGFVIFPRKHAGRLGRGFIPCAVVSNPRDKAYVNMEFLIAYQDEAQKKCLKRIMPKIRDEILEAMSFRLGEVILTRDLMRLKKELTGLINQYVDEPIAGIYFEKFAVSTLQRHYYLK